MLAAAKARAFPEKAGAPMTPAMDEKMGTKMYQYGNEPVPKAMTAGAMTFNEYLDAEFHGAPKTLPWATDARGFHGKTYSSDVDRINTQYETMLKDGLNPNGPQKPKFGSMWEKYLSYHKGLYVPDAHRPAKSADDVRIAVSEFSDRIQQAKPNDACKYLEIEEFRCLQSHQVELDVQGATSKCLKWFEQWQQCKWDEHKFSNGISYVEGPELKRSKSYYYAPSPKMA
jgi:hypothetical protein